MSKTFRVKLRIKELKPAGILDALRRDLGHPDHSDFSWMGVDVGRVRVESKLKKFESEWADRS